jgi:hypothetical protein
LGVALGGRHASWAGEQASVGFDFRLAMHDLADPVAGYPEHAQLEFLPLRLRLVSGRAKPRLLLDDFAIARVVSLTSLQRFDLSASWRFELGARTLERAGCERCEVGLVRIGGGAAQAWADDAVTVFLMVETAVQAGPELSGIADGPVRVGLGPTGGLRLRFSPRLIALATAEWLLFPTQRDVHGFQTDLVLRYGLDTHEALSTATPSRPTGLTSRTCAWVWRVARSVTCSRAPNSA